MHYSANYKMREPEDSDYFELDDFNYNTEIIDAELYRLSHSVSGGAAYEYTATIRPTSWNTVSGETTTTVSIKGIKTISKISLKASPTVSDTEFNNIVNGQIIVSDIKDDAIVLKSYGRTPPTDIHLNIVVLGAESDTPEPDPPGPGPGPTPDPPTIVTWADGTDAEIQAMITAADAKVIDLSEYWHVGDERVVSLNAMEAGDFGEAQVAQDVTFVITALDTKVLDSSNPCYNYTYKVPSSVRTYPSAIVHMKNCLKERGVMNSTRTAAGGWTDAERRTWCDEVFKLAVPSSFVSIFKVVEVPCAASYQSESSITTTDDTFFFPAVSEIVGSDYEYGSSVPSEYQCLSKWPYYETADNKKKTRDGYSASWFTRSPIVNYGTAFALVNTYGGVTNGFANNTSGIVLAGCI